MADLLITASAVAVVEAQEKHTGPAAEDITAGQYVRLNTSNGKVELGKATQAAEARSGGIAVNSARAGTAVTFVRRGVVDLGNALGGLAYDADVYLSDTDGGLATTAGTVSRVVGTVTAGYGHTTADKLLRVTL